MKTRYWIVILCAVALLCLPFLRLPVGKTAQVRCNGELLMTISLEEDGQYPITTQYGTNIITVREGSVGVTFSDCPGQDCVDMGFSRSGRPIVCLPHHLVISFVSQGEVDGISG